MKILMIACAFLLSITSIAFASDVVQNSKGAHVLNTNRTAKCSTPAGRMSKDCTQQQAHNQGMRTLRTRH